LTFYQSSFAPGDSVFYVTANNRTSGALSKLQLRQEESVRLPDGDALQVMDFIPEVRQHIPQASGPAIRLALIPKSGTPQGIMLLRNHPDFDRDPGDKYTFSFDRVDEKWRTGLQITRDPGVWIVWTGCGLLLVGIGAAFFMSHRRIWVRIEKGRITIAGAANKNAASFAVFFERLAEKLKTL
jgi:cytochrome c biogenesis protein